MTPQYFRTMHLQHSPTMPCVCSCVHKRIVLHVEGSGGVSSAGCVVHVAYMESRLCCGWLYFIATEHGLAYGSEHC